MNKRRLTCLIILSILAFAPARSQRHYARAEADAVKADTVEVLLSELAKDADNVAILDGLCSQYTMRGEYDNTLKYAGRLREIADAGGDERAGMLADLYTGQSYLLSNRNDSIRFYLDRSHETALLLNETEFLSKIHNALGIYSTGVEMSYLKGIEYFLQGMEYAREAENQKYYLIALCNLSTTYYMRNDPAGLKYAEEVYELGRGMEDKYIVFGGAVVSAYMRHMIGDNEKALQYIEETLPLTDKYNYHTEIYSLYANVLHALGDDARAEHYYRLALEHLDAGVVTAAVMTYLSYATYLIDKGESAEAIPLLKEGIRISVENNNAVHRYLLYQRMSEALSAIGEDREALRYFQIYHNEADSIFNVEREYSINELRVKYEAEQQENELQKHRINSIQEQRKLQVTLLLVVILVGTCAVIYILYRRKDKMYRQIVIQQHEFLKKERRLAETAAEHEKLPENIPGQAKEEKNERDEELFRRLEHLMESEKIYRQNDLNIEKLTERLGTNRTYLSRAINQQSGMTFVNYINSYRIDEAVRRLSDVNDNIPLKALADWLGYNHLQTFYTSFQSAIGIPPSKYREKLMELYKKNQL